MKEKLITLKNQSRIIIKSASPDEADAMLEYFRTVCSETSFLALTAEEAAAVDSRREQDTLAAYEKTKKYIFLAAYVGSEVIATCSVHSVSTHSKEGHRARPGIAVKRKYWNLGVGSALLSTAIDFAKQAGYDQIELDAVSENANAIMLYSKFGFTAVASFPRAQKIDGKYYDCVRFVKYLKNES